MPTIPETHRADFRDDEGKLQKESAKEKKALRKKVNDYLKERVKDGERLYRNLSK